MKLSIIVPTLDGGVPASLIRAVENRADVEVVVVKGVSPVGKARNEGLRRAKGEYVAWVDADDEISSSWLDEIVGVISSSGSVDVVTFDAEMVGWQNGRQGLVWGEKRPTIEKLMEAVCHDLVRTSALWLYVTRRGLWDGVRFNEEVTIIEDFLVLPEVLKRAKSVAYLPKKLYSYFCNPKSLCHENNAERERHVIELKAKRGNSFSEKRYRQASQLCLAVAHYLVAVRVMHRIEGYETGVWRQEANKSKRWIRVHLPRILVEVLWHAQVSPHERLAWLVRFLTCAFEFWAVQKFLRRLRHG